jgi:hypothetical protein
MLRYLLILLLIWLIYRFIRGFFIIRTAARNFSRQEGSSFEPDPEPKKSQKMISKDEGEYVDFEEMDKH